MNDHPEKIWAWQKCDERDRPMGLGEWYTGEVGLDGDEAEYIRADLHLTRIRELENVISTALTALKSSRFVNAEHARAMGILDNAVKGTGDE